MKQKKNLIVFDIDGTLTDTVDIHISAFKKSLNGIGVPNPIDSFSTFKHHTDSFISKAIYEGTTKRTFDHSIRHQFEHQLYEQITQSTFTEIADAKHFVDYLEHDTDYGVCFATGSLLRPAKHKLDALNITFQPIQLVPSDELEEREQLVSKAIKNAQTHYNVEKFERIISFGDGLWDLQTANNLNLEFVGIGATNKAILTKNGMTTHFNDFKNLTINQL